MLSRKNKLLLLKGLSLFSIIRGYNVLMITLAQYMAFVYILAPDLPLRQIVLDPNLFVLVLASALAISGGYIINSFYDSEKDLINRPNKTMLDRLVDQRTKLSAYFVFNLLSVFFASYVSFRAVVFFFVYIFAIWLYSHRLKKIPFLGNLVSAILIIIPFFAILVYYKNFEPVIFVHAVFLFLIILAREVIKDMENIAGDLVQSYRTIPILYGIAFSKSVVSILISLTIIPALLLIYKFDVGYMSLYFISCIFFLIGFLYLLWKAKVKEDYIRLHNIVKFIIVLGVFSILLIDVDLVLNRII